MDVRTQRAIREHLLNPGDEEARLRVEMLVGKSFVEPELRFQADLQEGGRIWKALTWEMEFSRQSVAIRPQGGLVSCAMMFGNRWTHVRIWYPTLEDLICSLGYDDVRISVSSGQHLSDVLESMEDNFPGTTVVSSGVAMAQGEKVWSCGDVPKPLMRSDIDLRVLAETVAAEGTRASHSNAWLAG